MLSEQVDFKNISPGCFNLCKIQTEESNIMLIKAVAQSLPKLLADE